MQSCLQDALPVIAAVSFPSSPSHCFSCGVLEIPTSPQIFIPPTFPLLIEKRGRIPLLSLDTITGP